MPPEGRPQSESQDRPRLWTGTKSFASTIFEGSLFNAKQCNHTKSETYEKNTTMLNLLTSSNV